MLNTKFLLTKFFVSSFYAKPKQPMLKAVLIIAFCYIFVQLTTINIAINYLGNTEEYLFYNFIISNLLVYGLVIYFALTTVFHYFEFGIMAHMPISSKDIIVSKIGSMLLLPTVVSAITQIPTLLSLGFKAKFTEIIKLMLFIPLSNILIILLVLFILALINSFRHHFINKATYFIVNIIILFILSVSLCVTVIQYIKNQLFINIISIDLTTFTALKQSLSNFIQQIYELVLSMPIVGDIAYSFTSSKFSLLFIMALLTMSLMSVLLFLFIVKILSIHYFENGLLEGSQLSKKRTKVYHVKNEWANYLQRELWVIHTEPYFKMQIVLGVELCPILVLIFLTSMQAGWLPISSNFTKQGDFELYFAYGVLLIGCINNVSGTPYSREGKYYHLLRSLPLNSKKIYFSKVVVAAIPSGIAVTTSFIIFMLFGYMNKATVLMMLTILILMYCYNLLTPVFDMIHPSIDWENPSEAVKSNPNVLVSLLFGLPILVIVMAGHFFLLWLGVSNGWSTIIIFIITTIITIALNIWFSKYYFRDKTSKLVL
ncbi:hypothetical protein ACIQXI_08770 [Lysinibacillus sp. NPDC097195]|uniref:hypothetical protein n=1 Tax=Lysinibacillus sp. NPDC097195 TaxID=3364141 RepID=UPI0037F9061F